MSLKTTSKMEANRRIWALTTMFVFVLLGFVDFVPAANKGEGFSY